MSKRILTKPSLSQQLVRWTKQSPQMDSAMTVEAAKQQLQPLLVSSTSASYETHMSSS